MFFFTLFLSSNKDSQNSDYKRAYELHFTLQSEPPSNTLLPNRTYTNLKSLSFSSKLADPESYNTDTILADLQKVCSKSALENIKRIYLYNKIYPMNFRQYRNFS